MAELNLRTVAVNAIRRVHERLTAADFIAADEFQLEQELKTISNHFERFTANHDALVGSSSSKELESHEGLWVEVETRFNEACAAIGRLRAKLPRTTPHIRTTADEAMKAVELKLEPLSIPVFDGALHNWLAFKDVFETLVHNTEYPEAYKLGKLRQAVHATTVPLVGGLYSGGYEEVWQALKERFDNRKQLAEIHCSRFLNIRATTEDTAKALLTIVDTVNESLRALKVMKLPVEHWDALTVPIVTSKLPVATHRDWCMSCDAKEIPSLEGLLKFLQQRAHSLSTEIGRLPIKLDPLSKRAHTSGPAVTRHARAHMATVSDGCCAYCQGPHRTARCPTLLAMSMDQRFEAVKGCSLCYNCLKPGHSSRLCPSGNCRQCGRKHNTVLCRSPQTQTGVNTSTSNSAGEAQQSTSTALLATAETGTINAHLVQQHRTVLLATARAYAFGTAGQQCITRLLCDPGSQVSFVSERLATHLHLYRTKQEVLVEGIGSAIHTRAKGSVTLKLQSLHSNFVMTIPALVIPSITSATPSVHLDANRWRHIRNLKLADQHFCIPSGIDILVGADSWGLMVKGGVISGKHGEPHAQNTQLGWVVFGPTSAAKSSALPSLAFSAGLREDDVCLEELVQSFWKLEEVPGQDFKEDDECSRIFASTHLRTPEGRYVVQLPLKSDMHELGDSYANALRQFSSLERRLATDDELREKYIRFMREYAALGHMERVHQPISHHGAYYIPHHAVTAKFLVVFNASARTSTGVSLNDLQLVGPTIQDSLVNILLRFRRYRTALTGDIEKMFRQVLVAPAHRDYQRIIWRETPSQDIGVYRLTTVTYGMACSPFNAVRALNQCANDNFHLVQDREAAILARDAILTSFYVDDFLTSCSTDTEALDLARNVDTILSAGQFKLRKWNSNSIHVLLLLTDIHNSTSTTDLAITPPAACALGLRWDYISDELYFQLKPVQQPPSPTKRRVLSAVAQLFDPTGLLAPVVIVGKLFIQAMWSAGIAWDEPLPPDLQDSWTTFRQELELLNQVRVPRWLRMTVGQQTTLHGFCDASLRAYAAVLYTKTTDEHGCVHVSLLTARTKVAPLKGATIPRLELCAALLLAQMLQGVRVALGLTDNQYHLWSDSRVVLCWLRKPPTTLKPYISNRVRQIQELTTPGTWDHVASAENPADCASRGIKVRELLTHHLWWHGPPWLTGDTYASNTSNNLSADELETLRTEVKTTALTVTMTIEPVLATRRLDGQVIPLVDRFSTIEKLLCTTAVILRWSPTRRSLRGTVVTALELEHALMVFIRIEQRGAFPTEIRQLQNDSNLNPSSKLSSLHPYVDEKGIIRVGGRINKAALPHDQKFPIILPKSATLVRLLIHQAHRLTLHGGPQLTLQTLRQRFWILNARQAVKAYVNGCVVCRRHRGATLTQQMASLPRQRVNAARPFSHAGVDYCGPFTLRIGTKRSRVTTKAYLAIFICLATKAVHIEVVDDLSAPGFLDAFTRFISRRGPCLNLYSDNGTAFVGGNRLLQEDFKAWHEENNQRALASMGTTWRFITPSAPHQGGIWEAAVKSAKHHLLRAVGAQTLWRSQLQTLAARIEACLNSRPLTPLYDDPSDKFALTPGDFLVGGPLVAVPEPDLTGIPSNRLKHWQWIQQVHQHFWSRWSDEYLSTLQKRHKWQRRSEDVRIGDIVLVRHDNLPPTHWRLGRITAVHPGSDGIVRNVTLRTANGDLTRPVQKLCPFLEPDSFEPLGSTGQDV